MSCNVEKKANEHPELTEGCKPCKPHPLTELTPKAQAESSGCFGELAASEPNYISEKTKERETRRTLGQIGDELLDGLALPGRQICGRAEVML